MPDRNTDSTETLSGFRPPGGPTPLEGLFRSLAYPRVTATRAITETSIPVDASVGRPYKLLWHATHPFEEFWSPPDLYLHARTP